VLYAGSISASKGVSDCIDACAVLNARHCEVSLTVAGSGDLEAARQWAKTAGVESKTRFMGSVASETVQSLMRESDVVVVPSRHDFAEGLPNTIYEALASRTPLVASDHPAFADRLAAGRGSLQFRAADPRSLAEQIERLAQDRDLYRQLSETSAVVLDSLYVGIEWTELVRRFLDDPGNSTRWVEPLSLRSVEARMGGRLLR
jgi:glycosyltransferase involved in cell wall biosynthesis